MEVCNFEIAKKLREKGFKGKCVAHYYPSGSELIFNQTTFRGAIVEDCLYSYNSLPIECIGSVLIDAPTISQVLKWIREEKKMHIIIPASFDEGYWWEVRDFNRELSEYSDAEYETYEKAAIACIEYVLDNLI